MVPNPWYIGNSAQNQKESSGQLSLPHFIFENLNRISKKNKIGKSKSLHSHPLQNVSVKHMQTLLDLVKRSSVSNCHTNGEYILRNHSSITSAKRWVGMAKLRKC